MYSCALHFSVCKVGDSENSGCMASMLPQGNATAQFQYISVCELYVGEDSAYYR